MMKKVFTLAILLITAFSVSSQDMLEAMLTDSDETTNIRSTPGGNVVMKLNSGKDDSMKAYVFMLTSPQNGWWKIDDLWNAADDEEETVLQGSDTGEYWIHYSVLGVDTRNYGGQELYLHEAPDEVANIVFTFNQELTLMPMDVQGDWVKVKVSGFDVIGWIEVEWLCSNPLTNCC